MYLVVLLDVADPHLVGLDLKQLSGVSVIDVAIVDAAEVPLRPLHPLLHRAEAPLCHVLHSTIDMQFTSLLSIPAGNIMLLDWAGYSMMSIDGAIHSAHVSLTCVRCRSVQICRSSVKRWWISRMLPTSPIWACTCAGRLTLASIFKHTACPGIDVESAMVSSNMQVLLHV